MENAWSRFVFRRGDTSASSDLVGLCHFRPVILLFIFSSTNSLRCSIAVMVPCIWVSSKVLTFSFMFSTIAIRSPSHDEDFEPPQLNVDPVSFPSEETTDSLIPYWLLGRRRGTVATWSDERQSFLGSVPGRITSTFPATSKLG